MEKKLSKTGNQRRKFICDLSAITGAAVLAPQMVSCGIAPCSSGAKKNAPKVKVVFSYHLADIQDRPDWPNLGYDFRPVMTNVINALNTNIEDVEFISAKANGVDDGKRIVEEDNQTGNIAGYMVMQLNCWNEAIVGIVDNTDKPVLYTQLAYAGDGGWLRRNSQYISERKGNYAFMSAVDINDLFKVAAAFSKLNGGTTEDVVKAATEIRLQLTPKQCKAEVKSDVVKCLTPAQTLAKLKGVKILSAEAPYEDQNIKLKKDFGIEIIPIKFEELNSSADGVDRSKIKALADSWKNNANNIEDVTDETLYNSAKMYWAMKNAMAKYGAVAITVNCLGGCYSKKLDGYPCLGFMQLQDDGLFGVCEDDINSTVSMILFNYLTNGRMGYVSDPVLDPATRSIIYAHCVATRKFFGPAGPSSGYEILTHSEDREGASVRTIAPMNYPVTTVQVAVNESKILVHTGTIIGNSFDDRACRTKIIAEVNGDYEKIYKYWQSPFSWHRVTFIGDFSGEIKKFADAIGYEVIWEC